MIDTNRNTTAIINNSNRIIGIDGYINGIAIPSKSFIYCIIYNFINKMMQAS